MIDQEEECRKIIEKNDYYDILGVEKTADETQIKREYIELAIKFHPGKNKTKNTEEAFKKINQAFSVLSDKNKRKNYDLFGTENGLGMASIPEDFNPFDIFNQFFGDLGEQGFSEFNGCPEYTRAIFNNGLGNDDENANPFEESFFGERKNGNNNNSNYNYNRYRGTNTDRKFNEQSRKDLERNIKNATLFIQLFPLICCILIFFVIPCMVRLIFP